MFSIFALAIKFDCTFLTIFQSFFLFVSFIFDKLAPPPPPRHICFKRCFKSLLVHSSAFNCLKSAKNVVFFSFCILVNMPMGGYSSPSPPWLRYCIPDRPTGGCILVLLAHLHERFLTVLQRCKATKYTLH